MPVHLQIVEDAVDVARAASQHICAQVRERSDAVLGLATGSTPEATYAELVQLYRERALSFARVRSVNLDEALWSGWSTRAELSPLHANASF